MGNTQTVAFQLPTSNGPVLRDVEGNEWRYLRYPKETLNPRAHRGDNHGHHSDLCWWYLDRPEEGVRYMVDAEYGLPCVHNNIQLCGNGAVRGDGVWYVAAQYEGTALTYVAALVSELPHTTHHKNSRYVRFRLSDLIAVRGELGHPPVETAAFDEKVADHIQLGNRIIDYYTWLGEQECDEEHLAHPNRSARYRARAEQIRRPEKALREGGYDLDKIREGWQDFRTDSTSHAFPQIPGTRRRHPTDPPGAGKGQLPDRGTGRRVRTRPAGRNRPRRAAPRPGGEHPQRERHPAVADRKMGERTHQRRQPPHSQAAGTRRRARRLRAAGLVIHACLVLDEKRRLPARVGAFHMCGEQAAADGGSPSAPSETHPSHRKIPQKEVGALPDATTVDGVATEHWLIVLS